MHSCSRSAVRSFIMVALALPCLFGSGCKKSTAEMLNDPTSEMTDSFCESQPICTQMGQCVAEGTQCVATAETCKKCEWCLNHGNCNLGPKGNCKPLTDEDCLNYRNCKVS